MKLAIRVDASTAIGTGHLTRCLALAAHARSRGHDVILAAAAPAPTIAAIAEDAGWPLHPLPALGMGREACPADAEAFRAVVGHADVTLVDHYGLDAVWENAVGGRVVVIDDLADRPHACDLLIDQNPYRNGASRYDGLVPARCERLLGPRYALLREDFARAAAVTPVRSGRVERLLVFYGGIDATGETLVALKALAGLKTPPLTVDVVVGAANPRLAEVRAACAADDRAVLHVQTRRMAELTAGADLALGAGGTASLERCRLSLPGLVTVTADNQRELSADLQAAGAQRVLGEAGQVDADQVARAVQACLDRPDDVRGMSREAGRVFPVDGIMGPEAVMAELERLGRTART